MTAIADVRRWQTDMAYRGEHQAGIKSMIHYVYAGEGDHHPDPGEGIS